MTRAGSLFGLDGQVAIVTGASSGLGRHFALTLARAGAKVALAARRIDPLDELARQIEAFDGRAIPVPLDVTDPASVRACVGVAETELGPISILVNNAGLAVDKPVFDQDEADWDRVLDTNLKGAWMMAQEVARHMARLGHGGSLEGILLLGPGQDIQDWDVWSRGQFRAPETDSHVMQVCHITHGIRMSSAKRTSNRASCWNARIFDGGLVRCYKSNMNENQKSELAVSF